MEIYCDKLNFSNHKLRDKKYNLNFKEVIKK